jgi:hypothetical protein
VAYHSAETARDRDRLRQQVLEARGWTIIRVWSTDWFKDRAGQIERLMNHIAEAKEEAKERTAAEAEAEARGRELAEIESREAEEREARAEAESLSRVRAAAESGPYVRPTVPAYRFAEGEGKFAGADFTDAPMSHITAAIIGIVEAEGPVHIDDVASRVAGMWGMRRVGKRISAKVNEAVRAAVGGEGDGNPAGDGEEGTSGHGDASEVGSAGGIVQRNEFLWPRVLTEDGAPVPVRSRAGTKIPGNRIAHEEIREAIRLVLQAAGGMARDELLSEVRHVLGVGKAAVAPGFDNAIEGMIRDRAVGEGSTGYALMS